MVEKVAIFPIGIFCDIIRYWKEVVKVVYLEGLVIWKYLVKWKAYFKIFKYAKLEKISVYFQIKIKKLVDSLRQS